MLNSLPVRGAGLAGSPAGSSRRPRFHWRQRRTIRWALACALVVAAAVTFLSRGAGDVIVYTATSDLPSGHHLTEEDVTTVGLPDEFVPDGASTELGTLLDNGLTGPIRRGEILTDARVSASGTADGAERARVVPIPVAESGFASRMRPGSVVDVVVARPAEEGATPEVLADDAVIVDVTEASVGGGMTLLLRLPEEDAVHVAARALDTPVTVTMHG